MDTLAVQLCTSLLPTRTRDFHPLERAHGAQTKNRSQPKLGAVQFSSVFYSLMTGISIVSWNKAVPSEKMSL